MQLVLASDGETSFSVFLYPEGRIEWVRGQGKNRYGISFANLMCISLMLKLGLCEERDRHISSQHQDWTKWLIWTNGPIQMCQDSGFIKLDLSNTLEMLRVLKLVLEKVSNFVI